MPNSKLTVRELPRENDPKLAHVPLIQVAGRLDTNTVSVLERELLRVMASGAKSVVLDMENLTYVSSTGLRVLMHAHKETRARKGKMVLCSLTPPVRDVLEMVGFTNMFDIRENLEQGKKSAAML
jgi:anti-anti-sigma factor